MNLEPVGRAMHRRTKEGLTRHDSVHAISSVVATYLFDILKAGRGDNPDALPARYFAAVERLTATSWRQGGK
jgi:hypothetical protein